MCLKWIGRGFLDLHSLCITYVTSCCWFEQDSQGPQYVSILQPVEGSENDGRKKLPGNSVHSIPGI